jgi:hypothetical protein
MRALRTSGLLLLLLPLMMMLMLSSIALGQTTRPATDDDVNRLREMLVGSFDSAEQAKADPQNYFDIRLQMAVIWADRRDGPWLYVEQAAARSPQRPYRQRIYRLLKRGDRLVSEVYELPGDPLRFAGAANDATKLGDLKPDQLTHKAGCDVVLWPSDDGFVGGTVGCECPSKLAGASYATSEVRVFADRLETWDRGYDKDGKQVWGAEKGPYIFRRK